MVWLKGAAGCVGGAILASLAHINVIEHGGYGWNSASITPWSIAAGVAVASVCFGAAVAVKRYPVAVFLLVCVVAGEAYNLITSAERQTATRDAAQAPLRQARIVYDRAQGALRLASVEVANWPATTPRI